MGWLSSACVQHARPLELQARRDLEELRATLIAQRAAEAEAEAEEAATTDEEPLEVAETAAVEQAEPAATEPPPPPGDDSAPADDPAPETTEPRSRPEERSSSPAEDELPSTDDLPTTLELTGRVLAVDTGRPPVADSPLVVLASPADRDSGATPTDMHEADVEAVEISLGDGDEVEPGFAVTSPGRPVTFVNRGEICHSYFSTSPSNEFDLGLLNPGESRTLVLQQPGSVQVYCSLHAGKRMSLVVAPTPHYALVAADGSFTLEGLDPGPYDVEVWGDELRSRRLRAEVPTPVGQELRISVGPDAPEASE